MADVLVIDCETGETSDATFEADPATVEAAAWQSLRAARDHRLAACDWTQLADTGVANEAERQSWADYRQALRDLTETTSDPANPVWPEPPAPLTV